MTVLRFPRERARPSSDWLSAIAALGYSTWLQEEDVTLLKAFAQTSMATESQRRTIMSICAEIGRARFKERPL